MRTLALILILSGLLIFAAQASHAASFDCRKARSPDEIAVCNHHDLSELDTEMDALWFAYRQLPFLMGMSGVRRDQAGEFLQKRAACGPRLSCLRQLYISRNKALREDITTALDDIKRQLNK